jgi:guanine nucleotide-exchange factor
MAEAGGAFVTRSFKRLLNDAPGRKYNALQTALKAYLERKPELTSASHHEEPAAAARDEIHLGTQQENSLDGNPPPYTPNNEAEIKSVDVVSPVLAPAKPSTCQAAAATLAEAGHTLEGSEADLVILPLLLAFESKQSKLIETALDCLHKLISYGHLEGEAGLEGGKNTERVTKILNLVCASVDGTSPDRLSSSKVSCLKTSAFLSLFSLVSFFLVSWSFHWPFPPFYFSSFLLAGILVLFFSLLGLVE